MAVHGTAGTIHQHRAYDEPQENATEQRRLLWENDEYEREAVLRRWEQDSLMIMRQKVIETIDQTKPM